MADERNALANWAYDDTGPARPYDGGPDAFVGDPINANQFWDVVGRQHMPAQLPNGIPRTTPGGSSAFWGTTGAINGAMWAGGGVRRRMAVGAAGLMAGLGLNDWATGGDDRPYIPVDRKDKGRAFTETDPGNPNSVYIEVPPINYGDYQVPNELRPPGALSALYKPIDNYVAGARGLIDNAKASANEHMQGGAASRGGLLADMITTGVPSMASTALKTLSAPVDLYQGNQVDFGGEDAFNALMAGGGAAARSTRRAVMSDQNQITKLFSESLRSNEKALAAISKKSQPMESPVRTYRGSRSNEMRFTDPEKSNGLGFWSSNKPEIAETYALGSKATVVPGDVQFRRPFVIDGQGAEFSRIPMPNGNTLSTDYIAQQAGLLGHDGVIFKNIKDAIYGGNIPSDVYHAIQRGTVRSPYTKELLYGLPAGVGAGAAYNALAPRSIDAQSF
jgi:hypothetical protein